MPTCPFCKANLSDVDLRSGQCPSCGRALRPAEAGDRQAPPVDSVPEGVPGATPPAKESDTADDQRIAETLQAGPAPVPPPAEEEEVGTADERRIAETLEASAAPVPPPAEDARLAEDRRISEPGDEGELAPEAAEKISLTWSGTFRPQTSPLTSIKAELHPVVAESNLIIQPRVIRQREAEEAANADYELMELLGEGGMGIVYAARQASINRTVAVKMLKPAAAAEREQRGTFLSEAVVTGDLEHPNIVPIYDLGTSEKGALFYSMKRVKGTPWNTAIPQKSFRENIDNLMKLADAVAFAHSRGVVHRDLKPENVMLGDFGEVLLMDWGLAVSPSTSSSSGMGGTPAYMAPEMATGPVEAIGFHSDIYLLGAILFEIVTGKPPHTGENVMQCLFAAAKNRIRPTEQSGELLNIALKAMATAPEDRYVSVRDFQAAIREYQSHSESVLLSTRAEEDLAEAKRSADYQTYARALFGFQEALDLWGGNTRARSGVAETSLAYATSALEKGDYDLGASLLDPDNPAHADVYKQIKVAEGERNSRQQRLKTAKRVGVALVATLFVVITGAFFWVLRAEGIATAAKMDLAGKNQELAQTNQDLDETNTELDKTNKQLDKTNTALDGKNKELAQTIQDLDETNKQLDKTNTELDDKNTKLAVSLDREAYAAYIARIGLAAAKIEENAFDKALEVLNECPAELRNWEWRRLMHLCTQDVLQVDAQQPIDAVAFSPDGKRFITGGWGDTARIWDAQTGKELVAIPTGGQAIPTGGQYVFAVAFSPDGKHVATGINDRPNYVKIWDSQTGALVRALPGHKDTVLSVVYSRDGKRLLTSSYDGTAILWDVEDLQAPKLLKTFIGHDWWVWSAAFSPDENRIVTASQDGSVIVWSVESGEPERTFLGHAGPVYAAAFSPDEERQYVASAGYDKRVILWDPNKVKPFDYATLWTEEEPSATASEARERAVVATFEGHTAGVCSVQFSAGGKRVVSGSNDNTVRVWDVATRKLLKTLRGHGGRVRSCVFSPDGHWVLSGSHDHHAKIWSLAGYEEARVFQGRVLEGHVDAVLGASFSPDGGRIASASRDRTAKAWDAKTGAEICHFKEGHDFLATTAVFFPDGKKLLTAAVDNTTRIWDIDTGTQLLSLEGTGPSAAVALSHDAKWILTGSGRTPEEAGGDGETAEQRKDGKEAGVWTAKLWDAETGKLLRPPLKPKDPKDQGAEVTAVAISPDDTRLLTGDAMGVCRLWDAKTGEEIWKAKRHSRSITAVFFLPEGKRVLTASTDNTVAQWDVKEGREELSLILKHPDAVTSMALSPDGKQVLTTCPDRIVKVWDTEKNEERGEPVTTVRLWDVDTAKEIGKLVTGEETINAVAFSPDGRRAVTTNSDNIERLPDGRRVVTASPKNTVRLWDLQTFREITTRDGGPFVDLEAVGGLAWSAVFSPNGKQMLTVGGEDARLWDVKTGRETMEFRPHGAVASANFSPPDGKRIVTGSWDNTARIWNAQTGIVELKLEGGHTGYVNSAVFSPGGNQVLTASDDKTAVLWDANSGKILQKFEGHQQRVRSAVFSSDGERVLTASNDKTARIWNAGTGKESLVLRGHQQAVLSAAFSADGNRVITGSEDNTAKLWDASTGEELPFSDEESGLTGHSASVTSVGFSPDGTRVITGSQDTTAKVWELIGGEEILTLKGHSQEVTSVAFSPDRQSVLTGSRDGTLILWLAVDRQEQEPRSGEHNGEIAGAPSAGQ